MSISSDHSWQRAVELYRNDEPFYALIMAAMLRADTDNTTALRTAFPQLYREVQLRYHAPGGLLPDDMQYAGGPCGDDDD